MKTVLHCVTTPIIFVASVITVLIMFIVLFVLLLGPVLFCMAVVTIGSKQSVGECIAREKC
jgi:hypothetical protein